MKKPREWKPIPPNEKDFLSQNAGRTFLLAYIEELETQYVALRSLYMDTARKVDPLIERVDVLEHEVLRLKGERIITITPEERKEINLLHQRDERKRKEAQKRLKAKEAARTRMQQSDRIMKRRSR